MGRPAAARSVLAAGVLAAFAESAPAQQGIFAGMQKGVEVTATSVSSTTTFASGLVTKSETRNLFPALTLNMDALVYPNLRLNAGGVFELSMLRTEIDGGDTSSTVTRNRPFFLLRSTNPVFSPGFGYFRREDRARTAGLSDVKLVNDEYAGYLGWNPAGGPQSDMQILRTHTFDGTREFQDVTRDFGMLVSNYTYGNLNAYYRGSFLNSDDRVVGLETRQVTHAARISDAGALIRRRLIWNASYNINYQDVTSASSGGRGEVAVPVSAFAGLAALSDTPATARLSQNPALIDGNLTAGSGLDIGLSPPPENSQARNIGLDFVNPVRVNRLLIWVDRQLPVDVANSYSWEIYSSTDNVVWRRETLVSAAPFGPFENRFELDFSDVTARYLKVVTRPLSIVVPESSRFADVLVTEVQAFLRQPAGSDSRRLSETAHLVNTDVRMRLLDAPLVYYEGFFLYNGPSTFGTDTRTLSNGVSVNHTFARVFSVFARAAREQGAEPRGNRVATITNATFTVDPIPTFRTSLLYTGQDEEIAGLPNTRRGVFVQNAATVYRGIDVLFGVGWNRTERDSGEVSRDRLINATATIVPRQHLSLTLSYDETSTERSGTFFGDPESHVRRVYAAVAIDPVRTLHLVIGEEVIAISGQQTRTTLDLGVNWTPFQDGALQLVVAHNEALRALDFGKDRSTIGVVRWNLSSRSYIDVSYQKTRSEFVFQQTESRVFSVSVRLFA